MTTDKKRRAEQAAETLASMRNTTSQMGAVVTCIEVMAILIGALVLFRVGLLFWLGR